MKFPSDWKILRLSELSEDGITNGTFFDPKKTGSGYRHINIDQMYIGSRIFTEGLKLLAVDDATFKKKQAKYGDIFFTRSSLAWDGIAKCNVLLDQSEDFTFDDHLMRVRPKKELVVPQYLNEYCRTFPARRFFLKRAKRSTMTTIGQDDIGDLLVGFPPIREQEKISKILCTWDAAIERTESLQLRIENKLKGLVNREIYRIAKKRSATISDLFEIVSERGKSVGRQLPVLSVTQKNGVVLRSESGRKIKTISDDTSNYKVINAGDYVVSLRSFEGGIEYSSVDGLISPAYSVLRPSKNLNRDFYRFYFKSSAFLTALAPEIIGIRDGKQIDMEVFWDLQVPAPSDIESKTIAELWCGYESHLSMLATYGSYLQTQKQGLMQQLLTGKKRVKV